MCCVEFDMFLRICFLADVKALWMTDWAFDVWRLGFIAEGFATVLLRSKGLSSAS